MLLHLIFGLITTIVVCGAFHVEANWILFILGLGLSLLPDLDALPELARNGKVAAHAGNVHDHRDGLHYPLIAIPGIAIATYLVAGLFVGSSGTWFWTVFVTLNVLLHFILDSFGAGWGVKWLYPFSRKNYKLFTKKDDLSSSKLLVSWDPAELSEAIYTRGDPDWLKKYLHSKWFLIEVVVLLVLIKIFIYLSFYR